MLNNYEETSSGFTNNHVQTPASIPRSVESQKQQNIGPTWSYNSQLEGLYGCYQNEHQPVYNIHSMGHFEGNTKHNSNPYPQYSTSSIHQPVPTPLGKCHEACCQHLSDRYPINPAPLRYPPNGSVQPPRYGEISSNEHRQYFTERRPIQSSISRKKEFQAENGYSTGPPDRHFQYVGRGQIHVPERQSMQMIRSQYPMYPPINSYWSPRNWSGPRMGYPPPPPYHQSVTNQTSQLQSNLKMTEPSHYIDPSVSKSLSSQQRRALMRNTNTNPEIVRPIPETKRPSGNTSHLQGCYDFPYHSGFVPFNEVNKMSTSIPSQVNSSSCKVPIDKQFQQHQFTISNNDRAMPGCNNSLGDIAYAYPPGSYIRNSTNGLQQMTDSRKLSLQYEQQSLGKKRPDLDVRQFLATWDDDEEDGTRMSEPIHNNTNLAPYIVVDCRSLEGEAAAKLQERLKNTAVQNCQSKPQNDSSNSLNNVDPKSTEADELVLRDTDPQRSLIHPEYPQNSYGTTLHNDPEKNLSFWNPENRENCPESDSMMGKGAFQPLDCTKRDNMNVVEPIVTSKRDPLLHGDMNHKLINNDPTSHMSFDALVTYYGDSRRVGDGSYDLVEMTERLVNASDKICTIERNPLEQDMSAEGLHPCDPRNLQNQIAGNQSFHHRLPTRYASNNYQHYKSGINNDTFFNFKYPIGSSKFFGFDSSNMDPNYDYHKNSSEFGHQKSYVPKEKVIENYQSSTLSKNLDKIDLQDIERRGNLMDPGVSKKHHALNNYQMPEKTNLDFGVDPEQFITPIIIKKSDYYNKENYSDLKSSKVNNEVMEEGNGKTVLMHSNNVEADVVFKMSHSSNAKQVYHETNVVTLHSADQTESNTVTVEVPYDEQYSSLVKLSEEITKASGGDSNKIQEHHTKETKHGKSKTDSKEKSEATVLKKPTSFKLKRLPNSKEWIKVGGDVSLELKNAKHKSTSEAIADIPKPALNLNMPSLDDIRFIDESENKNESNSLKSIEKNSSEEIPGFSKSPNETTSSFKSDNLQLTQLAIVSPMKNQSLEDELIDHSKDHFDSNEENFLNSDSNHAKNLEITSQFSVIHSPYDTITLGDSHSPFVDLSSKLQSTSDSQANVEPSSSTVIDTFISESTKLEHNYSDVKKIQNSDDYTSTNPCLDINNDEMLCSGSTEHERNKEPFSPFHTYSECDMNSQMSAYFKLNNRICNSNKDIEPCIPSSPGVEEMFEDINHVDNNDNTFLEKSEEIPFVSQRDSPVIKSPCCRTDTFSSNLYNLRDSVDQQNPLEAPLNAPDCSLDFNVDKSEMFSKADEPDNSKTNDNLTVKILPAIPPINLKLNERKKMWCIAKKPKNFDPKPTKGEVIETKVSDIVHGKPTDDRECSLSPSSCKCDNKSENISDTLDSVHFSQASPTSKNLVDTNIDLACFSETITENNKPSEYSINKLSDLDLQHTSENKNVGKEENTDSDQKDLEHMSLLSSCEDSVINENYVNNDSLLPSTLSIESNCDFQGFQNLHKDDEMKEQTAEMNGIKTSDSITKKEDYGVKQLTDNVEHPPILFQDCNEKLGESDDNELSQLIPVVNTDVVNLAKISHPSEETERGENDSPSPTNMIKDNLFIQDLETETSKNEDCEIESCSINNCNYSCSMLHLSDEVNASFTTDEVTAAENAEKRSLHNSVIVTDNSDATENPSTSLEDEIRNTESIESCDGQFDEKIGSDISISKAKESNEVSLVNENIMEGDKSLQAFQNENRNGNDEQETNLITSDEIKSSEISNYSDNFYTSTEKEINSSEDRILEGSCQIEHHDLNEEASENLPQDIDGQTDDSKCDVPTNEENNTAATASVSNELPAGINDDDGSVDNITQKNYSSKFASDHVERENELESDTEIEFNSNISEENCTLQQRNNQEYNLHLCPKVKLDVEDMENVSIAEYITKNVPVNLTGGSLLQYVNPEENGKIYENLNTNERRPSVTISENNETSNDSNLEEDCVKATGTSVNFEADHLEVEFVENVSNENAGTTYVQKYDVQESNKNIESCLISAINEEKSEHSTVNKGVCDGQNKYTAASQQTCEEAIQTNVEEIHLLDVTDEQICVNQLNKQIPNGTYETTLKTGVEKYAQDNSNYKRCSAIVSNPSKSDVDNSRKRHLPVDCVESEPVFSHTEEEINQKGIEKLESNNFSEDASVFEGKSMIVDENLIDDNKSKSSSVVDESSKEVSNNIVIAKEEKDGEVNFLNDHCSAEVNESEALNSTKNLEEEMENSKSVANLNDDHKMCFPERSSNIEDDMLCDGENSVIVASNTTADMDCIDGNSSIVNEPEDVCETEVAFVDPKTNLNDTLIHKDVSDVRQCYEGTEIEFSSAELNFSINYESSTNQDRNSIDSSPAKDEFTDETIKCDSNLNIQNTISPKLSDDNITEFDQTSVDNCDLFGINEDVKETVSPANFQGKPVCDNTLSDQNKFSNVPNRFKRKDTEDSNEISSVCLSEVPIVESESVNNLKRKLTDSEDNDVLKNQRIESCTVDSKETIIDSSETEPFKPQLENKTYKASEILSLEDFDEAKTINVEENVTSNCGANKDLIAKDKIIVQNLNDGNSSCSENFASRLNCISDKESSYVRKSCEKLLPGNNLDFDTKNIEEENEQYDLNSSISIQNQNEDDVNKLNGIIACKERVSEFSSSRSNSCGECKELQFNVVSHLDSNNSRFTKCETELKSFSKKPLRNKVLKTRSRKRSKKPRQSVQYKPLLSNVKMEKISEKNDEFVRHTDTLLFKVEKRENEMCDPKGDKVEASITSYCTGQDLQSIVDENMIETHVIESSNLTPAENDAEPNNNGVDLQTSETQLEEKGIETVNTVSNESDVQVSVEEMVSHVSGSNLPDKEQSKPNQSENVCDKVIEKELVTHRIDISKPLVDCESAAKSKELGCSEKSSDTIKSEFLSEETVEKQMEAMYGSQSIQSDDVNEERVYLDSSVSSERHVVYGEISLLENHACSQKINTVCSGVDDGVMEDCDNNTVLNEVIGNVSRENDINIAAQSDPQSIDLVIPVYSRAECTEEPISSESQKSLICDSYKQLNNDDVGDLPDILITAKHDKECNTDFPSDSVSAIMKMTDIDTTPFQCLVEAALAVETADANKMAKENSSKTFKHDNSSNMLGVTQNVNIKHNSEVHSINDISESDRVNTDVVKKCKTKYRFPKPKLKVMTKAKKFKDNRKSYLNGNGNSKLTKYKEKKVFDKDIRSDNLPEFSAEMDGSDTENKLLTDRLTCEENVSQTFTTTSKNKTVPNSNTVASQKVAVNIESNESESEVLYVHVDSEKVNECVHEINLVSAKVIAETQTDGNVGSENEDVQNNLNLPNVELETGTNLVIIIEGLDTGETSGTLLEGGIDTVTSCENLEVSSEECKEIPLDIIVSNGDHLNNVPNLEHTSVVNSEVNKTDGNVGYDGLNANLSNDIANWPYVEEEVVDVDNNLETDLIETSLNLLSSIKCSLPWERIFNISNSKKRKIKRNKKLFALNGLELGPAKIELRLASESGAWKVVNNKHNDCVSPIVNVKRLILQRDPELMSYSEKESEEEIDLRERRNSFSQSPDDSLSGRVARKKNETELCIADKSFQPVVVLVRNKELDDLCRSMNKEPNSNSSHTSVNRVQKKNTKPRKRSVTQKDTEKKTTNEGAQKSDGSESAEELFPHNMDGEDNVSLTDSIDPAQEYVWRCLDDEEDWMDRSPLQNYCDQKSGKESFDEDDLTFSGNERRQSSNDNYSYVNDHQRRLPENGDIIETEYENNKSKDWKHLQDSESSCSQKESIIGTRKSDILQSLSFIFSKNRNRGVKRPSEGHLKEDTKRRRRQRIEKYPFHCRKCCIGFKTKEEMDRHKDSRHPPHRELHHCLLCQRSFSSSLRHSLHVEGRSHRHLELVQRHTMHAVHKLLTGVDFPRIRPLSHSERLALDWRPNQPGCVHYYHQLTPLQAALQDYSTRQDSNSGGQLEANKKTSVLQSSSETTK